MKACIISNSDAGSSFKWTISIPTTTNGRTSTSSPRVNGSFFPGEAVNGPRVPRETTTTIVNASREPWLSKKELDCVNEVLAWAYKNEENMYYSKIIKATSDGEALTLAVEEIKKRAHSEIASDPSFMASGPPAANIRGATPQNPTVDKGKGKALDKGKGKWVKPPKEKAFQFRTGGPLRIGTGGPIEPVVPQPIALGPMKPEVVAKKYVAFPPMVVRVLKLVDELDKPEEPHLKKRKLVRAVDEVKAVKVSTREALEKKALAMEAMEKEVPA